MRRLLTILGVFALIGAFMLPVGAATQRALNCNGLAVTIAGTAGDDLLLGTTGDDVIHGRGGDDVIRGKGGDDTICGGPGDDVVSPGPGDDDVHGGPGVDTVSYNSASGNVVVRLNSRTGITPDGVDFLRAVENVIGSVFDDVLVGNAKTNFLTGADGFDVLDGRRGSDALFGGPGDDTLTGGPGDDFISGGAGYDLVKYTRAAAGVTVDLLLDEASGDGFDVLEDLENIRGSRFDDVLLGDHDYNSIFGHRGDDIIEGRDRGDYLLGGRGFDEVDGGAGRDTCRGEVVIFCEDF